MKSTKRTYNQKKLFQKRTCKCTSDANAKL